MNFKLFLVSILLVGFSAELRSQELSEQLIIDQLKDYASGIRPEKIYISTDKNVYSPGDTVWFKAFLVDAVFHKAQTLSKVAYVELFDQNDDLVQRKKLYLSPGSDSGEFILPIKAENDYYSIRAYTNYMRNWWSSFYYTKSLRIWNPLAGKVESSDTEPYSIGAASVFETASKRPVLRMFPEAGNIVSGINSRVAVELLSSEGEPILADLRLVDEEDNVVSRFKTHDRGLGLFAFNAEVNKSYKVILDYEGITQEYLLARYLSRRIWLKCFRTKRRSDDHGRT